MRKLVLAVSLFLCLPIQTVSASDALPFQLIYRQENVVADQDHTRSDLLITVINLSGAEARDIIVSIPVMNPYVFVDSPIFVATIPDNRQAEILHRSSISNEQIALSEPEENLVWRIEYTDATGERALVEVKGVRAQ